MLARATAQTADLELAAGLQGTDYSAALACPVAPTTAITFLFVDDMTFLGFFFCFSSEALSGAALEASVRGWGKWSCTGRHGRSGAVGCGGN